MPDEANGKEAKMKKKMLALLMAAALALGVCAPAFGATVSNGTPGHTYVAYQVLSGTQAEGDSALGDVVWGEGVNGDDLLKALEADYDYFDECASAADVANVLDGKADDCSEAKALAATATKHLKGSGVTVPAGDSVDLAAGYWLLVDRTNPVDEGDAKNAALLQVTNKGDVSITKKYDVPKIDKIVDKNDANIGDEVVFTLTATMPSRLDGYETYKIVFHDTLSAGLEYADSLKVKINCTEVEGFSVDHEGGVLTVSCDDVLKLGAKESSTIVVTYKATLDDDAVIGTEGNPNEVYLEYSNDPNWDGDGTEPTGNTPEVEVKVFTWEIPVSKVDGKDASKYLAGAEFSLFKNEDCSSSSAVNVVLSEGNVYKVCAQDDCSDHSHATIITTDASGKFEIEGLQKGAYYLKEVKAPAGYNLLPDPVKVVIGDAGALAMDDKATDEIVVKNNKGTVLPETGGIGTTLFYAVGGLLVVGAVALLIMRRRAGSEE